MHLSPFVPSVIFGRILKSLKMFPGRQSHPPLSENYTLFFVFFCFLFKVHQTPLKSMHLSSFVTSIIFRRIPKSLKMVLRLPPLALEKTPLFFVLFKVCQPPLKSMNLSPFVPSVIFGRIPKSLKIVPDHHTLP